MTTKTITTKEVGKPKVKRPSKPQKPSKPVRYELIDKGDLFIPEDEKEPGFDYRWVNDEKNHLKRRQRAGWDFATKENGEKYEVTVNSEGLKAYFMKIPKEFLVEKYAAQEVARERDMEIRSEEAKESVKRT